MNELVFVTHALVVFGAAIGAFLAGQHMLQALACLYVVFANLFVIKKMYLCGFVSSGGDVYIIGSICAILMGRAIWGESFARRSALLSVGLSSIAFLLCWFQVAYAPSSVDTMQPVFVGVFGRIPAITFFSIVAHYVAQLVTVALAGLLSRVLHDRGLFYTTFVAMMAGQLLDALIFFFGVFGRDVSIGSVLQMTGVSTGIKLVLILSSSVVITLAVWCKERGYVQ
ncbi:MAG: queuosine precursor transporter [Candidatus Dependentiae bacterium]|nr:queuosine precursor transporter [Candidatus Dependentiae bacterium]